MEASVHLEIEKKKNCYDNVCVVVDSTTIVEIRCLATEVFELVWNLIEVQ